MSRSTGTEQSAVTLKIKVEFRRMRDISVDDRARRAVAAAISFLLVGWEEPVF